MWKLGKREREIMHKIVAPDSHIYREQLFELPGHPTIEDVLYRERISHLELSAICKRLPEDAEFYRFLEILKPLATNTSARCYSDEDKNAYKERVNNLKNEQAGREYQEMVKSVNIQNRGQPSFGAEYREMNRQLIVLINTLLTVAGAFAFGYFGVQLAYPAASFDIAPRLIIGLILGTIVFFADLYFIVKTDAL